MLVAKIDELVAMTSRDLDEILAVTEQLEPDRAQSCQVAIALTRVMLDEIRCGPPPSRCRATPPDPFARRSRG